jgi:hypothetical protein
MLTSPDIIGKLLVPTIPATIEPEFTPILTLKLILFSTTIFLDCSTKSIISNAANIIL